VLSSYDNLLIYDSKKNKIVFENYDSRRPCEFIDLKFSQDECIIAKDKSFWGEKDLVDREYTTQLYGVKWEE